MNAPAPRVVFFGMRCAFSAVVLQRLRDEGCEVAGIMLAAEPGELIGADLQLEGRFAKPGTVEAIAQAARIPVRPVADPRGPDAMATLAAWRPDAIAVACFPRRLPANVLALPRLGALNVHPSLLPRHCGPDPLFWTFRDGDERTGVTVHLMTNQLDAGPIVAQAAFDIPFGIEGATLEARLADTGGTLLARAIARRNTGDLAAVEQDEARASSEGFPTEADLAVETDQSARWAFSFVRGIASLGFPATVQVASTDERLIVGAAQECTPGEAQSSAIIRKNDRVAVQFIDGICEFSVSNLRKTLRLHVDTASHGVR